MKKAKRTKEDFCPASDEAVKFPRHSAKVARTAREEERRRRAITRLRVNLLPLAARK